MAGWITSAGKHPVEHINVPHGTTPCDMTKPPAGVLHTTEGSWEGSLSVFTQHFAPHFMVGKDGTGKVRIAQFVPIGTMAAALINTTGGVETNRWARAQIEIIGFSNMKPWQPSDAVSHALAALMDTLSHHDLARIPLRRPFPDTLEPGVTWASPDNPRRRSGRWGVVPGWYGHVEVPENDHWDPGSLQTRNILALAPSATTKITGYRITYTTRKGDRATVKTRFPTVWMQRHPDAKKRGGIVIHRILAE